jgi:hypothetical protein
MRMRWWNLPVLAAFFWAAPLSAEPRSSTAGAKIHNHLKSAGHNSSCPGDQAKAPVRGSGGGGGGGGAARRVGPSEYPPADVFLLDMGRRAPTLLP